jgi:hypothetical protein
LLLPVSKSAIVSVLLNYRGLGWNKKTITIEALLRKVALLATEAALGLSSLGRTPVEISAVAVSASIAHVTSVVASAVALSAALDLFVQEIIFVHTKSVKFRVKVKWTKNPKFQIRFF